MMFYALVFVVVMVVVAFIFYGLGRSRASEWDKTRQLQYKEAVREHKELAVQNVHLSARADQYESALTVIASGRGGSPEITAAAALASAKQLG